MMTKNKMIICIFTALMLVVFAAPAMAAAKFYNVTVDMIGVADHNDDGLIMLSDTSNTPAFTNKWFTIDGAIRNEMLSIALVAVSTGLVVKVKTDVDEGKKPELDIMYLVNE